MRVDTGSAGTTGERRGWQGGGAVRAAQGLCALLGVGVLLAAGTLRAQSGLTAAGTINAQFTHKSGIAIVFNSNAGGVALNGGGTFSAKLDLGNISRIGALATGVSRTTTATDYTVSSPFDVYVELAGGGVTRYTLTAALASAPGAFTYTWDTAALSTTAVNVVTNATNFNTNVTHTLYLTVPNTAAAGAVSNTINVTATAN